MKCIEQILEDVRQHKTCTRRQLYRYIKTLGIKPLGARQRPQLYPDDAAQRVLMHLGFSQDQRLAPRIATMKQLRSERAKAQRRAGKAPVYAPAQAQL